ncbi:hypothetical protein C0993_010803 [Termitomyces sp. T159_Od127]|nr:hypothetical protein C0993_010803 [Termitomyces sp. T159_Od127]
MSSTPPPTDPPVPRPDTDPDVDPQILEALRSKDRIYVLKLGELIEGLIADRRSVPPRPAPARLTAHRPRIDLTPSTSYQRLLVHRCAAYYKVAPENDPASKGIFVVATADSRMYAPPAPPSPLPLLTPHSPARRLCDLVPPEATAAPAFKIMRRSPPDRRANRAQSQAGSVAGDDADFSDADPSESGSLGGRSNATGRSNKSRMTIEEREAAYNEARSRIFMGFEEKEKEKDMSASSSSISLASGSTSGGGGSSVSGDIDEPASSPATESEYSAPGREKRVGRNGSASSSSRSLRYSSNQGSSRNSRASSPSPFTYANIYEPNQTTFYDHPPAGYNQSQYMYPYPPPGMPHTPYYGAYPYYQYPYPTPPPQTPPSDPSTPSSGDPYSSGMYPPQYAWTPHPPHPMQSPPPPQMPPPGAPPPPMHSPQYPYMPSPHPYAYPMPGYYQVTPGPPVESPPGHINNHQPTYDVPRSSNGSAMAQQHNVNETSPPNGGKNPPRHSVKGRSAPVMNQGRGAWSFGPGPGQGGRITSPTEAVGPRLNYTRRPSNNSIASSATSRSSTCDDVASTASSSTTSSSSRRTTTSSQHPLPARPDWAVGLKPQPTLHSTQTRHRDNSHSNSRTMSPIPSPSRNLNGNGHHHSNDGDGFSDPVTQPQPASLQSPTEFPPLSSGNGVAPEKRLPVVSGAWVNNAPVRNVRLMAPQHNAATALVHHPQPASNGSAAGAPPAVDGAEDGDRAYERPRPKSAELFNPKVMKRPAAGTGKHQLQPQPQQEKEKDCCQKERERGKGGGDVLPLGVSADLVEQMGAVSLDGAGAGVECQPKEAVAV